MSKAPPLPIAEQIELLQEPIRGRRWLSWVLFLSVLTFGLLAPVIYVIDPFVFEPEARSPSSAGMLKLDTVWNPGALASAHRPWADDCKTCHSTPFARVKDEDCMACHKASGDHVDRRTMPLSPLQEIRCATCHRDHQGEFGLITQNKRYVGEQCASCHADIKTQLASTATRNVSDFVRDHPPFRVQVADANVRGRLMRVRAEGQARKLTALSEPTSLKFPHKLHLASAGISGPRGPTKLECATCHQPTIDGVGFQPVTMKGQCQSCHALKFDTTVFNREVPHGSVDEVLTTLREVYSYVGQGGAAPSSPAQSEQVTIVRPGVRETVGAFATAGGGSRGRAAAAATQLFEKTSCVVCHEVTRVAGPGTPGLAGRDLPQWRIAPVAPTHAWLPKATFNHAKHRSADCSGCHDAAASTKASDVLIPGIAVCKDCHSGKQPEQNKVVSDCGLCHGYHPSAHDASTGKTVAGIRAKR